MKFRPLKYVVKEVLPSYERKAVFFFAGITVLISMTKCTFLLYILVTSRILINIITLRYILGQVGEI
jgi:hypothetical protein